MNYYVVRYRVRLSHHRFHLIKGISKGFTEKMVLEIGLKELIGFQQMECVWRRVAISDK